MVKFMYLKVILRQKNIPVLNCSKLDSFLKSISPFRQNLLNYSTKYTLYIFLNIFELFYSNILEHFSRIIMCGRRIFVVYFNLNEAPVRYSWLGFSVYNVERWIHES